MKENNNKKKLLGFIFLFVSAITLIGISVAYFSDIVTGGGTATAGTLDINGTYSFYLNGSSTPVSSIANFNPGDVVAVKATITNSGNKSAWLRNTIDFGTIDPSIASFIQIYEGEVTAATIEGGTLTTLSLTGGLFTSTEKIIDGTGTNAETETGTNAIGTNATTVAYTIYFDKNATNGAQNKTLSFSATTQAMQYRNNITPNWSNVVSTPFTLVP